MYKHAQKHHKKYIWGAAGFFGLFKLFSFLLVSIFGYTLTQANTPSISFLEIPATTIDVQDNKSIVQFDLRAIDPSYYTSIKNISLHLDIVTENTSITLKTLRNNKINALGEKSLSSRILQLQKNEDTQRILNPMSISGIIQELLSGNAFVYLLPEEPVYLSAYDVSLEIEIQAADNQTISGIEDMPIQELETYKEAENISLQNTEYTTSMSIISSFFATGKDADPYLHRDASSDCQFMNTSLIPLQAGIDTIPRYLSPDTIYVLEPGIYISNYMTEITGSCTALIGINSGVHLFTSKTQGAHIKISGGRDAILHNLNLYGEDDGVGGSHTPNNYGIFVDAQDTTVYGIWAHNYLGFGVYMEDFDTLIADVYSYTHESVFLYPYADTYIDESKKFRDYNYGKSDQLDLDHKGTKSLLQFDLSSLPSSATVLSGQMRLTRVGGNANDFFAKKILNNNRKEGLGNGTLAVFGEVNYNFLGYQDRLWYGDEGMQVGMDYAYENVLEQSVFKKKNTPQWFDFTQEGISVLQDWVRYPQRNLGVVLTTDDKTLVVGSREYDNELYRPALRVDYMYEDTNAQNAPVLLPRTTDVDIVKEIMIANGYVDTGDNLVGTKPISLSLSEGNLPVATIMESVDDQIRIALPEDTKIKKENGSNYTGIFVGPKNISLSTVSEKQINQKAFKTFKIGSDKEKLFIKDDAGNVRKIFVTVPVVGYASGEQISVYYSHDNKILHFLRTVKVENSQGKSYIHFETDHFTTFELGSTMCSFTINGDASTTSTREVTLITADCKEGDPKNMIIGNDLAAVEAAIAAGKRVSFSREPVWTLLGDKDPGDATVYAAFTDGKDTIITSDTIYLSTLTSSCGDGMEGKSEQCDDGNTNNGDGCSSTC
ncbi:MAG TPA: DNRLRE domain-containing protein, partial [Candidatus Absconditabacterales bacterium]|nr:DNRLRE domain-containing protein [Candidatus Absconditabacterales bacterium]